ncbi:hypothetical protein NXS19_009607 [Fusarium pseudograminearum]|nr:hypothetical protein NXS19_009607 [Fusarium pseudograminearum]
MGHLTVGLPLSPYHGWGKAKSLADIGRLTTDRFTPHPHARTWPNDVTSSYGNSNFIRLVPLHDIVLRTTTHRPIFLRAHELKLSITDLIVAHLRVHIIPTQSEAKEPLYWCRRNNTADARYQKRLQPLISSARIVFPGGTKPFWGFTGSQSQPFQLPDPCLCSWLSGTYMRRLYSTLKKVFPDPIFPIKAPCRRLASPTMHPFVQFVLFNITFSLDTNGYTLENSRSPACHVTQCPFVASGFLH